MAAIQLKKYINGSWVDIYPVTRLNELTNANGDAIIDGNGKFIRGLLPSSLWSGLTYGGSIASHVDGVNNETDLGDVWSILYAAAGSPSYVEDVKGYYIVITSQTALTISETSTHKFINGDDNASDYTLETGDFIMFDHQSGSDYMYTIINNQYGKATDTAYGTVKLGSNTSLAATKHGTGLHTTANRTYLVQKNASDQLVVNVPWLETYVHDSITITEQSTSETAIANLKLYSDATVDAHGHLTGLKTTTLNMGTNITGSLAGGTLTLSGTIYQDAAATSTTIGGIEIGYAENGKKYPVELAGNKAFIEVPWVDTNTNNNTTYSFTGGISSVISSGSGTDFEVYSVTVDNPVYYADTHDNNVGTEGAIGFFGTVTV